MLIHHYDRTTGQYINSSLADPDPMNAGRWLVPSFCTDVPLPDRARNQWPFFADGAWKLLPDFRGQILYRIDDGQASEILAPGISLQDAGLTDTPQPDADHVWRNGAWVIDPALQAARVRAAAMAEFEKRLDAARAVNAGKADAYAAKLLSPEEIYFFRAWSAYQMELVRTINRADFPANVQWPAEPLPYAAACLPAQAEFDARMARALLHVDGKADDYADGNLTVEDAHAYRAWADYIAALKQARESDNFPLDVVWPTEPALVSWPLPPEVTVPPADAVLPGAGGKPGVSLPGDPDKAPGVVPPVLGGDIKVPSGV